MKYTVYVILLIFIFSSCGKDEKLAFENKYYSGQDCAGCPEIDIEIPYALEYRKISQTVNNAISEEVIDLLSFGEDSQGSDIPSAIDSFSKGFLELQKTFPDESVPWEAKISAEITYENPEILSIGLTSYIYTGGAHGYGSTRYLNFRKDTANEIEIRELFKDKKGFVKLAEQNFRIQEKIPTDQSINSTGFMFESDEFYLPENIGFTEGGIKLLYNPYEVASYADGSIELTLAYKDVKSFLTVKL